MLPCPHHRSAGPAGIRSRCPTGSGISRKSPWTSPSSERIRSDRRRHGASRASTRPAPDRRGGPRDAHLLGLPRRRPRVQAAQGGRVPVSRLRHARSAGATCARRSCGSAGGWLRTLYLGLRAVVERGDGFALAERRRRGRLRARRRDAPLRRGDRRSPPGSSAATSSEDEMRVARPPYRRVPRRRRSGAAGQLRPSAGGRDRQRELHDAAGVRRRDRRSAPRGGAPLRGGLPSRPPRRARGAGRGADTCASATATCAPST